MNNQPPVQIKQATVQEYRTTLDDILRALFVVCGLGLVSLVAVVGFFVLIYWTILDNFGQEGTQNALTVAGVLVVVLVISWLQSSMRRRDMQDITRVIASMTMHDVTIQRSDDQGEIMRQIAPKLVDLAGKRETMDQQRAVAMFQGALGMAKQLQPDMSGWDEDGAVDESKFIAVDDDD